MLWNYIINSVNKTTCCKLSNIDIRLFNKLLSLNDDTKLEYFKTKKEILHNQKVVEKEEKIKLVREMHKVGYSIRAISSELHMARETVSKYLKPDVSPIHACYGIKKDGGILLPYKYKINEYFSKRLNFKDIEANIRLQGYTGSVSLLRKYINTLKLDTKLQYEKSKPNNKNVIYIERKLIMKLLYKPLDKVKELDKSLFQLLCEQYPYVNEILDVVNNFRDILKSKKISKLDVWIENTFNLGISELKSFINGLNQDIEAVRNSISLEYNNSLAEGSVNKIKVIKRIMYGRCNFETLRNKIIKLENLK